MHHIDEHSIEQHVLGAPMAPERRVAIGVHLEECRGCRELAEMYSEFYADAARGLAAGGDLKERAGEALVHRKAGLIRQHVSMKTRRSEDGGRVVLVPPTRMDRVRYFIASHPVVIGAGSFTFLAGLAMAVIMLFSMPRSPGNPVFKSYNISTGRLEVFDRTYTKLWELPIMSARGSQAEEGNGLSSTLVCDLDGDGMNEVVTTERMPSDPPSVSHPLRVFRANKSLRFSRLFTDTARFMSREYAPTWRPFALVVDSAAGTGMKNVIVSVSHLQRSPTRLVRLDPAGETIGEYWHDGRIQAVGVLHPDIDGRTRIIAVGSNDAGDTVSNGSYAFLAVLDPASIVGHARSATAPGFTGLRISEAEAYYVRLPSTDINEALHTSPLATQIQIHRDSTFTVVAATIVSEPALRGECLFYFDLGKDMRVRDVRCSSTTQQLYGKLADRGVVHGTIDAVYLANLKHGVRYWDGREWQRNAVKIRHGADVAAQ